MRITVPMITMATTTPMMAAVRDDELDVGSGPERVSQRCLMM